MRTLDEIRQTALAVHGHTDDHAIELICEMIAELAHHICEERDPAIVDMFDHTEDKRRL